MEQFEDVYREHFISVYRFALSLCRDEALAEELTQETFFRAMEHLDSYRGQSSVFVWLCQIAKNRYYSLCRKRKHIVPAAPEAGDAGIESAFLERDDARRLHRLLHELREPYKEVFSLRVFGELPFSQIGELFEKSESWARLVFYRAKNELRRQMDEQSDV